MIKTKEALSQTKLTRRQFLHGAAVSTAGFMLVPSGVLGLNGVDCRPADLTSPASALAAKAAMISARWNTRTSLPCVTWTKATLPPFSKSILRRNSSRITMWLELWPLLRNESNESHSDLNGFALHPADSQGQQTACKPRQSTQIFGV